MNINWFSFCAYYFPWDASYNPHQSNQKATKSSPQYLISPIYSFIHFSHFSFPKIPKMSSLEISSQKMASIDSSARAAIFVALGLSIAMISTSGLMLAFLHSDTALMMGELREEMAEFNVGAKRYAPNLVPLIIIHQILNQF